MPPRGHEILGWPHSGSCNVTAATRFEETIMRLVTRRNLGFAGLMVICVLVGGSTLGAQYSMTVNGDRLINAQNEPQNWLMMNGDYGSPRSSQLTPLTPHTRKTPRPV